MIAALLTQQILVLFIIMACGFLLVKLKLFKSEDSRTLSVISVYMVMPCVIINAFQIDYTDEIRDGFLLAIVAAIGIHIVLFLLSWFFGKVLKLEAVEKASIIYSNAGNLIIPLVTSVLGAEWVIYASAFMCVQMVILWTHGQSLMQGTVGFNWRRILANFNLLSIVIGMALFFLGIKLPTVIGNAVSSISSIVGPICMIMLGMLLANVNFKEVFSGKRIYIIVLLKMLVFPMIILLILKFSGLATLVPNGETILLISLLAVITPSATTVTQMAVLYDKKPIYASSINVFTTVVCILTMPLMVMVYYL